MTQNLNYYWQKRNEQEKNSREYDQLQKDIENGLAKNATKEKVAALEAENEELKKRLRQAQINKVNTEEYYKDLLTKDFKTIATISKGSFEETYEQQQTLLGEWMVSQRAFKELAIKFGIEAGRTKEEVLNERENTEIKVLNNQTEHGNNFDQNDWQIFYAPRIKAKLNIK